MGVFFRVAVGCLCTYRVRLREGLHVGAMLGHDAATNQILRNFLQPEAL